MTGNPRFAYDSYRRFITMYSDVVMGVPKVKFDEVFDAVKASLQVKNDTDIPAEAMKEIVLRFKGLYEAEKEAFPQDPTAQLDVPSARFSALEYRASHCVSPPQEYPWILGNRGERTGNGLRQSG